MSVYDLNCPFCDKVYKLPREKVVKHVGKTIYCRGCGNPFSVPPLPQFESSPGEVENDSDVALSPTNGEIEEAEMDVSTHSESNGQRGDRPAPNLITRDLMNRDFVAAASDLPNSTAESSAAESSTSESSTAESLAVQSSVPRKSDTSNSEVPTLVPGELSLMDEFFPEPSTSQLPPPFSAAVLPPISQVLPSIDEPPDFEPPTVDLASMADASPLDSADAPPYRRSAEQGAIAVDEEASFFRDDDSAEGISATAELTVLPAVSAVEIQRTPTPSPPMSRPSTPAAMSSTPNMQATRNLASAPVRIPAGLNLDDVPIARAVNPSPSLAPVVSINIKPLQRRLTILILVSLLIALLLAAILLAMLGYIPHRPA